MLVHKYLPQTYLVEERFTLTQPLGRQSIIADRARPPGTRVAAAYGCQFLDQEVERTLVRIRSRYHSNDAPIPSERMTPFSLLDHSPKHSTNS